MTLLLTAGPVLAQSQEPTVTIIRPVPSVPLRGSLARLQVIPSPTTKRNQKLLAVRGSAAGEPLHFVAARDGGFSALFGVPLEGADSVAVTLLLQRPNRVDTTEIAFAVQMPALSSERLRVDPAMAQPDNATRARIESEIERSKEVSRRSHETPRLWSANRFQAPRRSRVTSRYGTAREFNGEVTSRHLGTDYAGTVGDPVRAAGRGVVALVANFYLAGRAVYLDHGAGLVTGYFHLSRIEVAQGDTVLLGEVIGRVGRSGRVTGPHLHWIVRYGGISVDPLSLLRLGQAAPRIESSASSQ